MPDPEPFPELDPELFPEPEWLLEPDPEAVRMDADWVPKKASQHDLMSSAPRKTIPEEPLDSIEQMVPGDHERSGL